MTPGRDGVRALAEAIAGPRADQVRLPSAAIDLAIDEGVAPLLAASPAAAALEAPARARLLDHVRASTIHDAALDDEVRRLLPALAAEGFAPLVIKGAHLAHTLYAASHLRPRGDTDLLIASDERDGVARTLAAAGYAPAPLTTGSLILGQFLFRKPLAPGLVHDVDVHWRAAAPLVFGDAFEWTAVAAASAPIAALGPAARGPAPHDALALACVHVVSHHWPGASLRWLYDLRLLAARLDDESRAAFARHAARGRYCAVAACALSGAREIFPAPALDLAIAALGSAGAGDEPSAALTRPDRTPFADYLLDLRVAGWRRGARLTREHLFPPPAYMRMAFAGRPLPIAYAARFVRALRRRW